MSCEDLLTLTSISGCKSIYNVIVVVHEIKYNYVTLLDSNDKISIDAGSRNKVFIPWSY